MNECFKSVDDLKNPRHPLPVICSTDKCKEQETIKPPNLIPVSEVLKQLGSQETEEDLSVGRVGETAREQTVRKAEEATD